MRMSINDSLSRLLPLGDPLSQHLLNPARMSTPIFGDAIAEKETSLKFEGLMSFKKKPCSISERELMARLGSPARVDSPSQSINFNETLIADNQSGLPGQGTEMPSSASGQLKDYLIFLIDTCKHSSRNRHKNIKLILFDLEQDKIAMLYELPLPASNKTGKEGVALPRIQLLNDNIHFCVWSEQNLWVYDLFAKQPIVSIRPDPAKAADPEIFLKKVTFCSSTHMMLMGFSNGDLIWYRMEREFNPFYRADCVFQFTKLIECNVQNLCEEYWEQSAQKYEAGGQLALQDATFFSVASNRSILNVLTDKAVLFINFSHNQNAARVQNMKFHNLGIDSRECRTFVLENPLSSEVDFLYICGNVVHNERVSCDRRKGVVGFCRDDSWSLGDFGKCQIMFDGIYDIGGPGMLCHEVDSQGNFLSACFYKFDEKSVNN